LAAGGDNRGAEIYNCTRYTAYSVISYQHAALSGSKEAMDCAIQNCQELINGSCCLLGRWLSLDALMRLVWKVYQFCTILKIRGRHFKILRNGNEVELGITKEIEEIIAGS
jgi:hypothetical protein